MYEELICMSLDYESERNTYNYEIGVKHLGHSWSDIQHNNIQQYNTKFAINFGLLVSLGNYDAMIKRRCTIRIFVNIL
jgi:hypothetical protein